MSKIKSFSDLQSLLAPAPMETAADWLTEQLSLATHHPISGFFDVTPERAAVMLAGNEANRRVNPDLLRNLSQDMKAGRWTVNGETIILSKDGKLNDGQHRLLAVIHSGVTIRTGITFGVERESRNTVDMGRTRTVADILTQRGIPYGHMCSAVANLYGVYASGGYVANAKSNKLGVVEDFDKYSNRIVEAIEVTTCPFRQSYGYTILPTAFMIISERARDPQAVVDFFSGVTTGENLGAGDARLLLRNRLMRASVDKLRSWERLELILRYWNVYRKGRALTKSCPIMGEYLEVLR